MIRQTPLSNVGEHDSARESKSMKFQRSTASQNNEAGRTMPVKFSLRVAAVEPDRAFVYNEELTVKICATNTQNSILQASTFADNVGDYGTNGELYITNFRTLKTAMQYTVSINRETFQVETLTLH